MIQDLQTEHGNLAVGLFYVRRRRGWCTLIALSIAEKSILGLRMFRSDENGIIIKTQAKEPEGGKQALDKLQDTRKLSIPMMEWSIRQLTNSLDLSGSCQF
jgi:hypothetical protein